MKNLKNFLSFFGTAFVATWILVLFAQTCFGQVRYGIVLGPARDSMTAHWNRNIEQAYCISNDTLFALVDDPADKGDTVYVVGVVRPAQTLRASPDSITFLCPTGQASVHTHPGQTTPVDIADCNPSRADWMALAASRVRYNVIQCGPSQFVFFFEAFDPLVPRTVFFDHPLAKP